MSERDDDAGVPPIGEVLRIEFGGTRPVRFAVLAAGLFGALAVGSVAATLLRLQFGTYPPFGPGIFGATTDPSDLFMAISSTYALLTQMWPVLAVFLGFVVRRAVGHRQLAGIVGSAAVAAGATVTLLLVGLAYITAHPEPNSVDVVTVFKPTAVAVLGTVLTCFCSTLAFGAFQSLEAS